MKKFRSANRRYSGVVKVSVSAILSTYYARIARTRPPQKRKKEL
jgi:hypothetical protein